jgi:hypothetical protein
MPLSPELHVCAGEQGKTEQCLPPQLLLKPRCDPLPTCPPCGLGSTNRLYLGGQGTEFPFPPPAPCWKGCIVPVPVYAVFPLRPVMLSLVAELICPVFLPWQLCPCVLGPLGK